MKPRVLLHVAELFEAAIAVGTFVGFFPRVDADVLDQLVVGAEWLKALLALMGLYLPSGAAR